MRVQKHFCLLVGVIHGKILFQVVKTYKFYKKKV